MSMIYTTIDLIVPEVRIRHNWHRPSRNLPQVPERSGQHEHRLHHSRPNREHHLHHFRPNLLQVPERRAHHEHHLYYFSTSLLQVPARGEHHEHHLYYASTNLPQVHHEASFAPLAGICLKCKKEVHNMSIICTTLGLICSKNQKEVHIMSIDLIFPECQKEVRIRHHWHHPSRNLPQVPERGGQHEHRLHHSRPNREHHLHHFRPNLLKVPERGAHHEHHSYYPSTNLSQVPARGERHEHHLYYASTNLPQVHDEASFAPLAGICLKCQKEVHIMSIICTALKLIWPRCQNEVRIMSMIYTTIDLIFPECQKEVRIRHRWHHPSRNLPQVPERSGQHEHRLHHSRPNREHHLHHFRPNLLKVPERGAHHEHHLYYPSTNLSQVPARGEHHEHHLYYASTNLPQVHDEASFAPLAGICLKCQKEVHIMSTTLGLICSKSQKEVHIMSTTLGLICSQSQKEVHIRSIICTTERGGIICTTLAGICPKCQKELRITRHDLHHSSTNLLKVPERGADHEASFAPSRQESAPSSIICTTSGLICSKCQKEVHNMRHHLHHASRNLPQVPERGAHHEHHLHHPRINLHQAPETGAHHEASFAPP